MRYRKKPTVVEAFQLTQEVAEAWFLDGEPVPMLCEISMLGSFNKKERKVHEAYIQIPCKLFNEPTRIDLGDWVIRDENGKTSGCDNETFLATYEPMPDYDV